MNTLSNVQNMVDYATAGSILLSACRYLKTQGRTQSEGPRRILTLAFKCVGTDEVVDLNQGYIKKRVNNP